MRIENTSSPILDKRSAVIARMRPDEAEQTHALFKAIVSELPYYNAVAKESELVKYAPDELRKHIFEDRDSVILAKDNQNIVGFCFSREDDGTIWLSWFGVHPNFRRMQIATALLEALEARARSNSSHKIWCDSRTNNEPSISALANFGFRRICTVHNHWYRQDFYLWEKPVL